MVKGYRRLGSKQIKMLRRLFDSEDTFIYHHDLDGSLIRLADSLVDRGILVRKNHIRHAVIRGELTPIEFYGFGFRNAAGAAKCRKFLSENGYFERCVN